MLKTIVWYYGKSSCTQLNPWSPQCIALRHGKIDNHKYKQHGIAPASYLTIHNDVSMIANGNRSIAGWPNGDTIVQLQLLHHVSHKLDTIGRGSALASFASALMVLKAGCCNKQQLPSVCTRGIS